ncbi:DUF4292 domain-containing protein [Pedobacter changchengzhani]|uniref:DUF4292 domain-containing protein n=1 Tax=Pedobacter changchengzhani TaxID=2529274 RepID=A0A4R5MPM3_9SPHI|nr:DUF4292 domain-containing protein [Pedobacter changchengzhani]TDG37744.1 DUF4292 domain-containing protein [Pedobacter changchengzhani]
MRRNILSSIALLLVVVLGSACKTKKVIAVAPTVVVENKTDRSKAETLTLLNSKQFKFKTLSLKAKASLEINGEANDVTMNIRIKDKQTIWVSVTAVGGIVEVARALITPDSIKIIDKINNKYIKKPFNYIYSFTNKQINFNTLQNVLTGNAIDEFLTEKSMVKQENGVWTIAGSDEDLDYKLVFNTFLKIAETDLNDSKNSQALKVNYSDYKMIDSSMFPENMVINTLSGKKKIGINLMFIKIDNNVPVDFPFTVPKRLEVVN